MSILNQAPCLTDGSNTGSGDCPLDVKLLQFIIRVPKGVVLTASQMASKATALAALQALVVNNNKALRGYPYPPQVTFTDNSTDPAFQTFGSGSSAPSNDGMYNWMFQFTKGGACLSNKLRNFNSNSGGYFIVVDAAGNVYGTKVGNDLHSIPANYIYTDKLKVAAYDAVSVYAYRVDFRPNYFNENLAFVNLALSDLLALSGLQDIIPSQQGVAPVSNVFRVKLTTGCGGQDLYDLYSAELADPTNFVVRLAATGNQVDITSVTAEANTKSFIFTLNSSDPDYVAGGPFTVYGSTVSALAANDVVGYEIGSFTTG